MATEGSTLRPEEQSPIEEQKNIIQNIIKQLYHKLERISPEKNVRIIIAGHDKASRVMSASSFQTHLNQMEARSYVLVDHSDLDEFCRDEPLAELFLGWHDSPDSLILEIVS